MIYYLYKLHCIDESVQEIYVGHTKNIYLRHRDHKSSCTNINSKGYNRKVYQYIRSNGGWDNWLMDIFHEQDCVNHRAAEKIEEKYRKRLIATLNSQKCYVTPEEKKEYQKEYNKEYRLQNKEKLKLYKKVYQLQNKEKLKLYQKEYRLNSKK